MAAALASIAVPGCRKIHPDPKVIPKIHEKKTKSTKKRLADHGQPRLNGYQWVEGEAECVSSPHSARIARIRVRIKAHRFLFSPGGATRTQTGVLAPGDGYPHIRKPCKGDKSLSCLQHSYCLSPV